MRARVIMPGFGNGMRASEVTVTGVTASGGMETVTKMKAGAVAVMRGRARAVEQPPPAAQGATIATGATKTGAASPAATPAGSAPMPGN